MGATSQGDATGHYISASMGGSNAHLAGLAGAMGHNELAMGSMGGVMPSAMMVNGAGMMGNMGQAHSMYSGTDVASGMSAAQAAAAAAQAQGGVVNPM
ncbi:hypothetical protein LPJ66_009279, partial [Kickxella alabastrina]